MTRITALFLLLASLALPACVGETTCETLSTTPTGDLALDIVGDWDGFGVDSRLVYVFGEDGSFRWIEPANRYAPEGLQGGWDYSVDGDLVTFEYPDADPSSMQASVTEDALVLTWDWDSDSPRETTWVRSRCGGYGY